MKVLGNPTPEELAAVVAVLAAARVEDVPAPAARSAWSDRAALLRQPLRPGPDAWRGR